MMKLLYLSLLRNRCKWYCVRQQQNVADGGRYQGIVFQNDKINAADILIFGGKPYNEPIVAEGPFVMNSYAEIATAYRDFFAGAYGSINLSWLR